MTPEGGALWLVWLFGCLAGWWWRGRCEQKAAAKHDRPAWMGKLGHALAAQFHSVEQGYRFTGDGVEISNVQTYEGGGKSFLVTVERKPSVIIDQ